MLGAVQELINILLGTHKGNWIHRVRKQLPTHEAQQVEKIMTDIENSKIRVVNRLEMLTSKRDAQTYRNTQAIKAETQATRYHVSALKDEVHGVSHNLQTMRQTTEQIYVQNQGISTQLAGIGTSVSNASANFEQCVEASVTRQFERWKQEFNTGLISLHKENQDLVGIIQTSMYRFMGEKVNSERLGWLPRLTIERQPLTYQQIDVPIEQIISVLDVNPTSLLIETQNLLRLTYAMQTEGSAKVRNLISNEQFRNWYGLPFPNILLVDGHCRALGHGRTSPLSIFCASLATSLAQAESSIVLQFFCSSYSQSHHHSLSGPVGLLRALIAQLILYPNAFNVPAMAVEQNMWESIKRNDIAALLALFEQVLLSLPSSKSMYIILDNVSDYQSTLSDFWRPTLQILQYLHRLADERRAGPQLKLFMTGANRTVDVPGLVDQSAGEYVSLHTDPILRRGGSIRGRPFEQDIRVLMESPRDTAFLSPIDQRDHGSLGNGSGRNDGSLERPRSMGGYI